MLALQQAESTTLERRSSAGDVTKGEIMVGERVDGAGEIKDERTVDTSEEKAEEAMKEVKLERETDGQRAENGGKSPSVRFQGECCFVFCWGGFCWRGSCWKGYAVFMSWMGIQEWVRKIWCFRSGMKRSINEGSRCDSGTEVGNDWIVGCQARFGQTLE
jgi:hypothetical protein